MVDRTCIPTLIILRSTGREAVSNLEGREKHGILANRLVHVVSLLSDSSRPGANQ